MRVQKMMRGGAGKELWEFPDGAGYVEGTRHDGGRRGK